MDIGSALGPAPKPGLAAFFCSPPHSTIEISLSHSLLFAQPTTRAQAGMRVVTPPVEGNGV